MKLKLNTVQMRNGYLLTNIPSDLIDEAALTLRVLNPAWLQAKRFSSYGEPKGIEQFQYFVWSEGNNLRTTRGFPLHRMSQEFRDWFNSARVIDLRQGKKLDERPKMKSDFKLNAEQKVLLAGILKQRDLSLDLKNRHAGNILVLGSTSVGKTLLQAEAALQLGYKTLVICPTDLIMEAWYNDLYKFYGLKIQNDPRVGIIKGAKFQIGSVFTIASLRTITQRDCTELFEEVGTLVADEVHKVSAPTFCQFVDQFPGKFILGATATQHKDGAVIHPLAYHFGKAVAAVDTAHKETSTSLPISKVHKVITDFTYFPKTATIEWHDLCNHLAADEDRNQLVAQRIFEEWKYDERTILVVVRTLQHMEILHDILRERGIADVNRISGQTNTNKVYTRSLIKSINARQSRCTIAILSAISTGANIRAFDSLHIVVPPVSTDLLEQLLGRLRRKHDGKNSAEVTWYLDANVDYLRNRVFETQACSVFRKMKIKGYEN